MQLRQFRETRGTPLETAAAELEINAGYLSQLEGGKKWPGPFIIKKVFAWSKGKVTVRDIFDNLDWSRFAAKPVRRGSSAVRVKPPQGESPNGKAKVISAQKGQVKKGRRVG